MNEAQGELFPINAKDNPPPLKKQKKKKPRFTKRRALMRLVKAPKENKRNFYAREMKFMNTLCSEYSLEFISIINFPEKFDSLAYLISPKLKRTLMKKFRAFNYKFDNSRYEDYSIGEKVGEDPIIKKKKRNIRDFLNE